MTHTQIEQTSANAISYTLDGKLKQALEATGLLAEELQWGDINDQIGRAHV